MPRIVTAESSPEEVAEIAKEFETILAATKLAFDPARVLADFKLRAAQAQTPPMNVVEWEKMWVAKGVVTTAAAAPAAKVGPKRKTKAEIAAEKEEAEKTTTEKVRGAVAKIDPTYFWMSDENIAIGKTWVSLRKNAGVPMNMFVVGPSGCGKTEGIKRLASDFDMPFYKVDCSSITTADKWVGHKEVNEKGTFYVLSEHLRWLSADGFEPGIILYDEINRLHPSLLNILIPILDGSQSIWVPDLGIYVKVHPDTMIAATANLGTSFSGTYALDAALQDRFGVVMEQVFPPESEEIKILTKRTGIDDTAAHKLIQIAKSVRSKAANGDVSRPVSTRNLLDAAWWVVAGQSITEAAESTFVKKFSMEGGATSERMMVRVILQGVAAGK